MADGWGKRTVADTSVHPPVVTRLHYEFSGWLGDDLLTTFPCFIVTEPLAAAITAAGLTGYELAAVEVSRSPAFGEWHPGLTLPPFRWLRVNGTPGADDFWLAADHRLAVSERAMRVLKVHRIDNCLVEEAAA